MKKKSSFISQSEEKIEKLKTEISELSEARSSEQNQHGQEKVVLRVLSVEIKLLTEQIESCEK